MQIQLKQLELETAVRDYVLKMGITSPVGEIAFRPARSQGNTITTEIEVTDNVPQNILTPRAVPSALSTLKSDSSPENELVDVDDDLAEGASLFGGS